MCGLPSESNTVIDVDLLNVSLSLRSKAYGLSVCKSQTQAVLMHRLASLDPIQFVMRVVVSRQLRAAAKI